VRVLFREMEIPGPVMERERMGEVSPGDESLRGEEEVSSMK
jgi:hypothetical protein